MPTLITKETLRKRPKATATRKPARRSTPRRKPSPQSKRRPAPNRLPDWADLQADATPRLNRTESYLAQVSTPRFFLLIFALAAACTLYVGHVHATQQTLALLQDAKQNNLHLHLKYNRLKSAYDANTGPAVIYERAAALGLEQSIMYGPTIEIP